MATKIIVVGGGLAGVSCANTILQNGGKVILIDKSAFCGGNSTKATSGINGTQTSSQQENKVQDSVQSFKKDIQLSATKGESDKEYELGKVMAEESGESVEWLKKHFDIDLSLVSQLGGHSSERTHRGKVNFPGMSITMGLLKALERAQKENSDKCTIVNKATVSRLLKTDNKVTGCVQKDQKGVEHTVYGPVVICTGGYGADQGEDSLLFKQRPDLKKFATTNGAHCTGDGIRMSTEVGASLKDMEQVQVHPTGLIDPKKPENMVKSLAAEALRGVGAIMLNPKGQRFVNELGRRDYVSGIMLDNEAPQRLLLGNDAVEEIKWHCNHQVGRGLMKKLNIEELAAEMKISVDVLKNTFTDYNRACKDKKDKYGRIFFKNPPQISDTFYVGFITPVVHQTMGGINVDTESSVLDSENKKIEGLWASGEVMGGVHGKNRLGGNSLLDCVVQGRISGKNASKYLFTNCLNQLETDTGQKSTLKSIAKHLTSEKKDVETKEESSTNNEDQKKNFFSMEEVAKHTSEDDCWVIVDGEVLNVTEFLPDHPGGVNAIMAYSGKDATENYHMFHPKDTIEEYAPQVKIGIVKK